MRLYPPVTPPGPRFGAQVRIATCDQDRMMRGLAHSVILSLAVWVTAGYVTLILR